VVTLKDIGDGNPGVSVFVRSSQTGTVVEVGTASQVKFAKQLCEQVNGLQGVNQQGLLTIVQELRVDAQAFF
jgi:uncharacterized UPF0146 family protein